MNLSASAPSISLKPPTPQQQQSQANSHNPTIGGALRDSNDGMLLRAILYPSTDDSPKLNAGTALPKTALLNTSDGPLNTPLLTPFDELKTPTSSSALGGSE